jgi:hypothetical protein
MWEPRVDAITAKDAFSDPLESENVSGSLFIAFSSREPVSTSLENALAKTHPKIRSGGEMV